MLHIAICDMDSYFRAHMNKLLTLYMEAKGLEGSVREFSSGREFFAEGNDMQRYQIVFYTISQNDNPNMELLQRLREQDRDVNIVLISSSIDMSIEGYKVDAVRFLWKNGQEMWEKVKECMDAIHSKMEYDITWKDFHFLEGVRRISSEQIVYVESTLHKLLFCIREKELVYYTMYDTLNRIETYIGNVAFVRCHQSYLLNMKYLQDICRYEAALETGKRIPIAQPRYNQVKQTVEHYMNPKVQSEIGRDDNEN